MYLCQLAVLHLSDYIAIENGTHFWMFLALKSLLVKTTAVIMPHFVLLPRDDSALQEIQDKVEVLEASQGLEGVTATLRELSNSASSRDLINLTRHQATQLKEAFICMVCRGV